MRLLILCFVLLLAASPPAWAGECYTPKEAQAEQGLRIQSELMVIGLQCQHLPQYRNLYTSYKAFAARHAGVFREYQRVLLDFFGGDQEALNALTTDLVNKIATDAARMRPDIFCKHYGPRIVAVESMDKATLRTWAGTFYPDHPVSRPLCEAR